ncbi:mycothiol system anti-sigma-R factor [Corynebacterium sp. CCM 9185]|nr:mycothiol system anti-sigma-R factor [Corynebacterium marambiense]MCK7662105.1 mycothiol system anti-sigma-R factor [Corynebacterium marambiense]MCX7541374.1 mycothiol system anti-sigma-R factor [Corynebacterium marambiense]
MTQQNENGGHMPDMADCGDVYESLFELLDGEATPERRAVLRAHIEACPGCFTQLGIEEEIRELMRRCCCAHAPVTLRQKIILRLRVERYRG